MGPSLLQEKGEKTMAVDIKLFAPVARATNAVYIYVKLDETISDITTAGYFNDKDLSGSVKVGDLIFVNAQDKVAILKVTAVEPTEGTITVTQAISE